MVRYSLSVLSVPGFIGGPGGGEARFGKGDPRAVRLG